MITVGLLVNNMNVFTNGCIQQAFYIQDLFTNSNCVDCRLLTTLPDTNELERYKKVSKITDKTDFMEYDVIIYVSLVLNGISSLDKMYIDFLKENSIKIVNLICGNVFTLYQEEIVFGVHNIISTHVHASELVDEIWTLEMYGYSKDFLHLFFRKPVRILPYVWNDFVINKYIQENRITLKQHSELDNRLINILIFEPNMSIHKNLLIPLIICEDYYRKFKSQLNRIFVYASISSDIKNKIAHYDIVKDGIIEFHNRIITPAVLYSLNKQIPCKNVVVSYNHLNNLNFIHLEMMCLGVPIVHNCEPFMSNGLYYDNYDISNASKLIEKARKEPGENNMKLIQHFSSDNKYRVNTWTEMITSLVNKQMCKSNILP